MNTKLFGQRVFSPFVFNATPQSQGAPRKPFAETTEHFVSLPECLFPSFEHMVHATSLTRHILSLGSAAPSQDNFSLSADYSTKAQNHPQRLGAGLSLSRFEPCVFLLCSQSIICVNTPVCVQMEIRSLAGSVDPSSRGFYTCLLGEFLFLLNPPFPSHLSENGSAFCHGFNQGFPKPHAGITVSNTLSILPQLLAPPLISHVKLILWK